MKIYPLGSKLDLESVKLPRKYQGQIAYSSKGRINLLDLETGQRSAFAGARAMQFPDWHPDGKSFATSTRIIYQQKIFEEQLILLAEERPHGFNDPSWNHDGTMLVFDRNIGDPRGIYIMNMLENRYYHTGLHHGAGGDWSPDGKRIAFYGTGQEHKGLFLMDVASKSIQKLPSEGRVNFHPHWHPDNHHIVFVTKRHSRNFDIYKMNVETRQDQELLRASEWSGSNFPQWSPDGEHIVFTHTYGRGVKYPTTLHIMRGDGTELTDLAIEGTHPTWWMNLS